MLTLNLEICFVKIRVPITHHVSKEVVSTRHRILNWLIKVKVCVLYFCGFCPGLVWSVLPTPHTWDNSLLRNSVCVCVSRWWTGFSWDLPSVSQHYCTLYQL